MTDVKQRVVAIKAALDKMTPEPWYQEGPLIDGTFPLIEELNTAETIARCGRARYLSTEADDRDVNNATGIVLLRNEAEWMMETIEKQQEEIEVWRLKSENAALMQEVFDALSKR